jgi:predicted O-linked N-acetylglucosamine transferase (SPINDLY family)
MAQADQNMQLAESHMRAGRFRDAELLYRQILHSDPRHAGALHMMGVLAGMGGKHDLAETFFRQSVASPNGQAVSLLNLALSLRKQGKLPEALKTAREAQLRFPGDPAVYDHLGVFLREAGEIDQAIDVHQRAVAISPDDPDALLGLAGVLMDTGRIQEAIALYRQALTKTPRPTSAYAPSTAHDQLLFALLHDPNCSLADRFAEHQRWNAQQVKLASAPKAPPINMPDPNRKLRIGYVSADFGAHPVGMFFVSLIDNHDRQAFTIICYSQLYPPDAQTGWFRERADGWCNIAGLSDDDVARTIRQDQIDILVDLSMHTRGHRLQVFARKPAPIQVTYLAYAGGTGVAAMDYRLTDPHLDPDESNDRFYFEKSIRLTGTYWCYYPNASQVPVSDLPARQGFVTFGCLNKFSKLSPPALQVWAQLLGALPTARLILHARPGSHRDRLLGFFSQHHIDPARIEFVPSQDTADYFRTYCRIDIALDPFPYSGGTTTCDALWMGVPVVTLAGTAPHERASTSILTNAGFPQWIATTAEQYVQIAISLAGDVEALGAIRRSLREKMRNSPLMDGKAYARSIERAYRQMWQAACKC